MQYVFDTNYKLAVITNSNEYNPAVARFDNTLYVICYNPNYQNLAKFTYESILEADKPSEWKADAILNMARSNLIDLIRIEAQSHSTPHWNPDDDTADDPDFDHYVRYNRLFTQVWVGGKLSTMGSIPSIRLDDESTAKVIKALSQPYEALDHLEAAGVIHCVAKIEIPFVQGFHFKQPKGSLKPDDYGSNPY